MVCEAESEFAKKTKKMDMFLSGGRQSVYIRKEHEKCHGVYCSQIILQFACTLYS